MKLSKVAITGADDSVSPQDLFDLSVKYPYVEWAILMGREYQGKKRFPSASWLNNFSANCKDLQIAGHLCGKYVNEFLEAKLQFIDEDFYFWNVAQRMQVNTHGVYHPLANPEMLKNWGFAHLPENIEEVIFQIDDVNHHIRLFAEQNIDNREISGLYDLSHGAGISPDHWPVLSPTFKRGYAGGLGPDNIEEQLEKIASVVGDNEIWIDMETKVRSGNDFQFDLGKVEFCLQACGKYVK